YSGSLEPRNEPRRGLVRESLSEDQNRNREKAANLNAKVLKKRLSRRAGKSAPRLPGPDREWKPGEEREEDRPAGGSESLRRHEPDLAERAKRRIVAHERESEIRICRQCFVFITRGHDLAPRASKEPE